MCVKLLDLTSDLLDKQFGSYQLSDLIECENVDFTNFVATIKVFQINHNDMQEILCMVEVKIKKDFLFCLKIAKRFYFYQSWKNK